MNYINNFKTQSNNNINKDKLNKEFKVLLININVEDININIKLIIKG